jgi:arabinogalactan oligomer / maltooligosaccharide transport system substrate-binding protein
MFTRRTGVVLAAVLAAGVLGGCGEESSQAAGAGELLVWAGEGTGGEAVKAVAARFGDEHGVDVTVELLPGDELQSNFVTASQAANSPDVLFGAHDWIGNLVQNGAIDPVQLRDTTRELFQPLALDAVTFNGQIYGMPFTMNSIVLYRNTSLAPEAPETIEQLVETGQQLKGSAGVTEVLAYPVGDTGNPYFIHPLYTSGGGYIFGTDDDGDYDPSDLGVGEAGSVEAYRQIRALGEQGAGVLKRSISAENALTLFTSGKAPFLVEGPWQLPNLADGTIEFDVSAVPGFEGEETASPFITVDAAYVASAGGNKVLAQEFVTAFWSSAETQLAYFEASGAVPASVEVLDQIQDTEPMVAEVARIGAANGQIMPSIPEMAAVWDPLGKAEAAVVAGQNPESTIRAASQAIRRAIG